MSGWSQRCTEDILAILSHPDYPDSPSANHCEPWRPLRGKGKESLFTCLAGHRDAPRISWLFYHILTILIPPPRTTASLSGHCVKKEKKVSLHVWLVTEMHRGDTEMHRGYPGYSITS
jgi:hypothetical protein